MRTLRGCLAVAACTAIVLMLQTQVCIRQALQDIGGLQNFLRLSMLDKHSSAFTRTTTGSVAHPRDYIQALALSMYVLSILTLSRCLPTQDDRAWSTELDTSAQGAHAVHRDSTPGLSQYDNILTLPKLGANGQLEVRTQVFKSEREFAGERVRVRVCACVWCMCVSVCVWYRKREREREREIERARKREKNQLHERERESKREGGRDGDREGRERGGGGEGER